ncbi:MAG: 50S ribosomal protein L3 [Clostridiales bacterium]|nr:50S ribosomal protein L3 [Clostridiales bacterium]
MKGIIGRKIGMTQVFTENGNVVPVTVVEAGPIFVTQIKTVETDGYNAVQVAFEDKKKNHIIKPEKGHFDKAGIEVKKYVQEFRVEDPTTYTIGQEIKVDLFANGQSVDVTGTSKGKGHQGVIRRWNHSRGPMTHGSKHRRRPGSIGNASYPGRVIKGMKMSGQLGNTTSTVQNLEIVSVDVERNLLLIKGAVPGPKKGIVTVKESVKTTK